MEKIVKLATDIALGRVQNFSTHEANNTLRNAFMDLMEISNADGVIDRKAFRRHKTEIFEIIEEVLNETIHTEFKSRFADFAEYRNMAWGDTNSFKTPANQIFRISLVSDGNGNIRRQRLIDGQEFTVTPDTYAVKFGEDFHRFLAGRVDFQEFMDTLARSFALHMEDKINEAMYSSYGKYNSPYHVTMNKAELTEDKIVEMAMHIQARTGEKVAIYGTKLALRGLAPSKVTEAMNNDRNKKGFYGEIAGIELREIEQKHKYGTDEFAIDNNMVLLLPENPDKFIKVVNEGDAIVQDKTGGVSADMMTEYFVANKFGISVITSKAFGFIKLT